MKTLLITADFPPRPGGLARYYADLARGLGRDCTVATGRWAGTTARIRGEARLLDLPFEARAAHRPRNLWRAARLLRSELRDRPVEAVIGGSLRPFGPLAARLARRAGVPLVQVLHGGDLLQTARRWQDHPVKRHRWRRLLAAPELYAVNSHYTADLAERVGIGEERICVVPPEVDTARFAPAASEEARGALRRRHGWAPEALVALFVGRLVERKGIDELFAALAGLPDPVRLVIAGPGELPLWRRRAQEAQVADRVTFLGAVEHADLPDLYRAADLFVAPSRDSEREDDPESFGIVFLEAAASGLPVLGTRTAGVIEAVAEDVNGLLVPPGDAQGLRSAWQRLAGDPSLRATLGRAGRSEQAARYATGSSARALCAALGRGV